MTTFDHLRAVLTEAAHYAPGDLDHQWRMRAAHRYAAMIAGRLDETRTAEEILADAMHNMKEAA